MFARGSLGVVVALAALVALNAGGCVITFEPVDGSGNTTTPDTITIRLVNRTAYPLDPQLYTGGNPEEGADGLFVPAHKQTYFGLGKLGIMRAGEEVVLNIKCGELKLFGTQGGIIGDDLTQPIDQGERILLREGEAVQCGGIVVFTFQTVGNVLIASYGVSLQGG